jgi:hypothetical protein
MLPSFDQPSVFQLVEDPDQSDRLDLEQLGEGGLVNALVLREIGDGLPLRTRQSAISCVLLESLSPEAGDLMN